jgi:hypothetical protein
MGPQPLPKCPHCDITTKDVIHGGKFGICKNAKCNAEIFENKDFTGIGTDDGAHSTSYNHSGRAKFPGNV